MALLKTIRSLARNPNPNPRSLLSSFHGSASPLPSPSNPAAVSAPLNPFSLIHRSRLFSPIGGGAPFPFSGPLFLSLPAWKLSQSATPLYLRGKGAAFPKDLLARRSFPIGLGLRSVGEAGRGGGGDGVGLRREEHNQIQEVEGEERFLNLPNLVSISRMVSGPFIGWMIMNEWYLTSFCGLVVSGATDWLDGFLARKMGINSVFGSYLDPLADKVLIGCVALAMVKKDLLHPALVGLVVLRDVALVSGAVYKRASSLEWEWKSWADFINLDATNREKVEPLLISKVNTVFQLLLVGCAILQPEFGTEETQLYITYLSWLVVSTTVASFAAYGAQHLRKATASAAEKWSGSSSKFS